MTIFGTPAKVSGGARSASSVSSAAVSTAAGDLIIVGVGESDPSVTISVADLIGGNSYTPCTMRTATGTGFMRWFFCVSSGSNGSNIATASFVGGSGAPNYSTIYVWDVPLSGSAVKDTDTDTSGSADGTSAAFNTTGTDEFVAAFALDGFGTGGYSAGSGYTLDSAGYGTFSAAEHRLFSSTQSGIAATFGGAPPTSFAIAIAFKAAGGAGPSAKPVVCIMQ
jgi:hypothetical protein